MSPPVTAPDPHTESRLQFSYFGLYAVLKRYRAMTILGWMIVLVGISGILWGWNLSSLHGLIDIAMAVFTILAGLAVVQLSVTSLSTYTGASFPEPAEGVSSGTSAAALEELNTITKEVHEGGWQEAFAAIDRLRSLADTHGLPALDEG